MKKQLLLLALTLIVQQASFAINYTWNGVTSSNWNTSSNWTPAGVPTSVDNVTISLTANSPTLQANTIITNLTLNSGTLNLGGFQLTATGVNVLNAGTISNGTFAPNGVSCNYRLVTINADVTNVTSSLYLNGATFNGITYLEKTGTTRDVGNGGNTFNGTTTIVNSGSEYLYTGNVNADIFNGVTTVNNVGTSSRIYFAHNHAGQTTEFNNATTFNANKVGGADTWSFFIADNNVASLCEFNNAFTLNLDGTIQSNARFANGSSTTVSFYGTTIINITTPIATYVQFGNGANTTINFTAASEFNINNTAASYIQFANSASSVVNFTATPTFNNTSTAAAYFQIAPTGTANFTADAIFTNSAGSTGGVQLGGTTTGNVTLNDLFKFTIGIAGYSSGYFRMYNLTQVGNTTPQNLTFTGTTSLSMNFNSSFDADVNFASPLIFTTRTTYNGTTTLTKTGGTGADNSNGNNVFNGLTTLANTSAVGGFCMGNTNGDQFNNDLSINNIGAGSIYLAHNHAGQTSSFLGNVTINNNGSTTADGVYICNSNATSTAVFSAPVIVNNNGTGTNSDVSFGNGIGTNIQFNAPVTCNNLSVAAQASINFANNGTVNFNENIVVNSTNTTITGGVLIGSTAGTATLDFNKTITIGTSGFTNGLLRLRNFTQLGTLSPVSLIQTTGTSQIQLGPNSTFNADVTIDFPRVLLNGSTYNGLATITKNGASSDAGTGGNTFNNITTLNSTTNSAGYFMTGNGNGDTYNARTTINNSGIDIIYIAYSHTGKSTIFNDILIVNNTSSSTSTSVYPGVRFNENNVAQNCIFNGAVTSNNTSTGGSNYIGFARGTNTTNTFNAILTVNNTTTGVNSRTDVGYNGTVILNNDVKVNQTTASNIYFSNTTNSTTFLNTGRTISVGSTGYTAGGLRLYRFTQVGSSTPQTITLTGTALLEINFNSTFNSTLNVVAPQILLGRSTYNGVTSFEKNGATSNDSYGQNTFNNLTSFLASGSGRFGLAATIGDDFNGNALFRQSGAGTMAPAYTAVTTPTTFAANISTVGTTTAIALGSNGGRTVINGNTTQQFDGDLATAPTVGRLTMSTTGTITLNVPVFIRVDATYTNGNIVSSATNLLIFNDNAVALTASNSSYSDGPVRKVGNDAFTFPVGKGGYYAPASIGAPGATADHFTAEYFPTDPNPTYDRSLKDPSLVFISSCEYWMINRTNGTSNVFVTLSWDSPRSCEITDPTTLAVARWNGALWKDHGNGAVTGNAVAGTVRSLAVVTSFSPFTLASTSINNPLPVTLIEFKATQISNQNITTTWKTAIEENNDFFTVERSYDGATFEAISKINGQNGNTIKSYEFIDQQFDASNRTIYYRLKQTDYNGDFTYSNAVAVSLNTMNTSTAFNVYPNPAQSVINIAASHENSITTITIVNSAGQEVLRINDYVTNTSINVSNLAQGVYTVTISNNVISESKRLIIQ
jgi:hypothetical protein